MPFWIVTLRTSLPLSEVEARIQPLIKTPHTWDRPHLIPLGMAVFGAAVTCGGFFPEAVKATRLFREAVGAA